MCKVNWFVSFGLYYVLIVYVWCMNSWMRVDERGKSCYGYWVCGDKEWKGIYISVLLLFEYRWGLEVE